MKILQFSLVFSITVLYFSTSSDCACLYTLSRSYSRHEPIYFMNVKKTNTLAIPMIINGRQVIEIQESDTLIVTCPHQNFVIPTGYYSEEFFIKCVNGTTQITPDNNFNPDHFKCEHKISTSYNKPNKDMKAKKLCEASDGSLYNVGIHVNFKSKGWKRKVGLMLTTEQQKSFNLDWYTMYTSCYITCWLNPSYTHYVIDGNLIIHRQTRLLHWKMDEVDVFYLKGEETEMAYVPMSYNEETAWSISLSKLKEFDINRYFDYERRNVVPGLLVPEDDMLFLAWKHITHSPFNVAPMWRQVTCSWRNIERVVKSAAIKLKTKLNIYTGIDQDLKLLDMKGRPVTIKLYSNIKVNIPLYFWKLVYHEEKKQAIVFVLCNNPYKIYKDPDTEELCPKKRCIEYGWNVDNNVLRMGQVYCCTAEDFFKKVKRFEAFKTHLKIEAIFHKP